MMDRSSNGNGRSDGNGMSALTPSTPKKAPGPPPHQAGADGNCVLFQTSEGAALRGTIIRLQRNGVVFELYNPMAVLRLSEALDDLRIFMQQDEIYSGRAVINSVVDAGTKLVCEATLDPVNWADLNLLIALDNRRGISGEVKRFLEERQKAPPLSPEFKVAVADLQLFLQDLRLWMDKVELKVAAQGDAFRPMYERRILETILPSVLPVLGSFVEKFEKSLPRNAAEMDVSHAIYARRMLHPLVLCSPFIRRTFEKPLGYAGDYEMVNMMLGEPQAGDSLFAKLLNVFFLNTSPVVAHRHRIDALTERLKLEVSQHAAFSRPTRIFNLGCGPAVEVQRFIASFPFTDDTDFSLLDFNEETIHYTDHTLSKLCRQHDSDCAFRLTKKSVMLFLKDNSEFKRGHYDFIYCAGLFDYLANSVCEKLIELFYELAAPGGLVLVSNVNSNNPSRGWMEYVLDWHLIYRNSEELAMLIPERLRSESNVRAVGDAVNILVEIRKPDNA
ncbi:MAG: class I SAM-dependent methyltransferase [Verrucomicrobiota bacterium]|nr:class I SAM-dependent methyltransferase [Verrucomicrobiota bacterium]